VVTHNREREEQQMDLLRGLVVAHVGHFDPTHSRPVVTGDTPAPREVLTHGETAWLCAPKSDHAIARAITEAKADEVLRRRIAEQGPARFSRWFSIDSLARDGAGVVLEALGRSASEAIRRPAGDEAS
jgi:glycosyltransferase involved in cell wall biosynthesis